MKKKMLWVLAATLICGASIFSSCSSGTEDNPAQEQAMKNRQEFLAHTKANIKEIAENMNFTTWNSVNFFNTYFNQSILLNDDFEKTFSRLFGQNIQKTLEPFQMPEGGLPETLSGKNFKYMATIDMTNFNYTLTKSDKSFDVTEGGEGLTFIFPVPEQYIEQAAAYNASSLKLDIVASGNKYTSYSPQLSNDSVLIRVISSEQYDFAISTLFNDTWTKNLYGTTKNTIQSSSTSGIDIVNDAWNLVFDVHSNIPGKDATDLYFALGQDPSTKKAGMTFSFTQNSKKMIDMTAVMANANGVTDLSALTSSNSITDIMSAIMAGNSIEELTITLLDDLTTNIAVSDCQKALLLQSEMAAARRSYADQKTIDSYVQQLNQLFTCSMSCSHLNQEIPMKLQTTKLGVDWWAVPALNFADENGYVPMTQLLEAQTIEYAINIIDHGAQPMQQAMVVVRQLAEAFQKLQKAFYDTKQ